MDREFLLDDLLQAGVLYKIIRQFVSRLYAYPLYEHKDPAPA